MSWIGSIHFSSAGKCLPLSRMQTILQAGLLAPGSSYLPAFPNRGSVALSAFVPVTAAGPLPARIDSTLTGFPITPFRHPEVRYFYIIAAIFCQLLRASINGASVAPSSGKASGASPSISLSCFSRVLAYSTNRRASHRATRVAGPLLWQSQRSLPLNLASLVLPLGIYPLS